MFEIKSLTLRLIDEYLADNGFVEMFTPKMVASGAEGGSTLFKVDYFGKVAYLAQSPQLYKQMLMSTGLDRVFEIGPAFRAEPSDTVRHVSEFISFDGEMAHIDSQSDVMAMIEGCTQFVISEVKEQGRSAPGGTGQRDVVVPKAPYPVIAYEKAIGHGPGRGFKIELGEDLGTEGEKLLGESDGPGRLRDVLDSRVSRRRRSRSTSWRRTARHTPTRSTWTTRARRYPPADSASTATTAWWQRMEKKGLDPEVLRVLPERLRLRHAAARRMGAGRGTDGAEDAGPEQHPRDHPLPPGPQPVGPLNLLILHFFICTWP